MTNVSDVKMKTILALATKINSVYRSALCLYLLISTMMFGVFNIPAMAAEEPVIAAASDLKLYCPAIHQGNRTHSEAELWLFRQFFPADKPESAV
jgi:hypothetical protein